MRRVPRYIGAAGAVIVPDHRRAFAAAGPVVASVIRGIGERTAVGRRAGQYVVLVVHAAVDFHVGAVAIARHQYALLVERRSLVDVVADAGLVKRIAMEIANVLRDTVTFGAEPRPVADAVAGVHGRLTALSL